MHSSESCNLCKGLAINLHKIEGGEPINLNFVTASQDRLEFTCSIGKKMCAKDIMVVDYM